jgi:hypothetical protein
MPKTPNDEPQTEQHEPTPIDRYHKANEEFELYNNEVMEKIERLRGDLNLAKQGVYAYATSQDPAGEPCVFTTSDEKACYLVTPRETDIRRVNVAGK